MESKLYRNWHKNAIFRFWENADGGARGRSEFDNIFSTLDNTPDIGFDAGLFTLYYTSVDSKVNSLAGCRLLGIEILDKRRIGVEIRPCRIPGTQRDWNKGWITKVEITRTIPQ